ITCATLGSEWDGKIASGTHWLVAGTASSSQDKNAPAHPNTTAIASGRTRKPPRRLYIAWRTDSGSRLFMFLVSFDHTETPADAARTPFVMSNPRAADESDVNGGAPRASIEEHSGVYLRFFLCVLMAATTAPAQVSVLTYHNDLARTGQNQAEIALTRAAVGSSQFGKLFAHPVDGYVYAQPLYVPGVYIPGKGPHNVVYVATEHDSVYAFDADETSGVDAQPLWHASFIDPGAGVTPVPASMVACDQIAPELGITGTPVIDPVGGTLYVVATTLNNGVYQHHLHALDIASGAERPGSPVEIQASVSGTGEGGGTVTFHAAAYKM